jgi:ribokinase
MAQRPALQYKACRTGKNAVTFQAEATSNAAALKVDYAPRITVVGSLNMDMVTVTGRVPKGGETIMAKSFSTGNGGKGANQATAVARLSGTPDHWPAVATVEMIGAVGKDEFGRRLKQSLAADGIVVEKVKECDNVPTGTATIIVEDETGENRILVAAGANGELETPGKDLVIENLLLVQLECPLKIVLKYMEITRDMPKNGEARVILNPSPAVELPADMWKYVDYLVLNESEAAFLSGIPLNGPFNEDTELHKAADVLLRKGAFAVIMTLGGEGVFYKVDNVRYGRFRAKHVKVVDTTGAGDTFVGAFAVRMARAPHPVLCSDGARDQIIGAIEEGIRFGMDAAALTVQKKGAQDSIPKLEDLPEWTMKSKEWKFVPDWMEWD